MRGQESWEEIDKYCNAATLIKRLAGAHINPPNFFHAIRRKAQN